MTSLRHHGSCCDCSFVELQYLIVINISYFAILVVLHSCRHPIIFVSFVLSLLVTVDCIVAAVWDNKA